MQKISLTIRVDAEELKAWKVKAGGNLSGWIREHLNDAACVRMAEVGEPDRSAVPSPADAGDTSSAKKPKTCAHGVSKGYRCWQCKGIAVIE